MQSADAKVEWVGEQLQHSERPELGAARVVVSGVYSSSSAIQHGLATAAIIDCARWMPIIALRASGLLEQHGGIVFCVSNGHLIHELGSGEGTISLPEYISPILLHQKQMHLSSRRSLW